jgi:hypothetical protein
MIEFELEPEPAPEPEPELKPERRESLFVDDSPPEWDSHSEPPTFVFAPGPVESDLEPEPAEPAIVFDDVAPDPPRPRRVLRVRPKQVDAPLPEPAPAHEPEGAPVNDVEPTAAPPVRRRPRRTEPLRAR